MSPMEGHHKAAKSILAYVKNYPEERIIVVDTIYLNHSIYLIEFHPNWKDF
jgi:hypothetical protein